MKLRIRGFEWRTGNVISIADFLEYLQEISTREWDEHILTIVPREMWIAGLLLTQREARAFCKMKREGAAFNVRPEQLEDGTNVVDFNFFLINPATGRGLYQHYQHSPTVNQFCAFCQDRFAELRNRRTMAEVEALGPGASKKTIAAISKKYLDRLGYSALEQPGDFEAKVMAMKHARALTFEMATLEPIESETKPLVGSAKRVRTSITFDPTLSSEGVLDTVARLAKKKRFKKATIEGTDANGIEAVYKLVNDVACFGEDDHATHADTVRIDSSNLTQSVRDSPTIQLMIKIAAEDSVRVLLNTPSLPD